MISSRLAAVVVVFEATEKLNNKSWTTKDGIVVLYCHTVAWVGTPEGAAQSIGLQHKNVIELDVIEMGWRQEKLFAIVWRPFFATFHQPWQKKQKFANTLTPSPLNETPPLFPSLHWFSLWTYLFKQACDSYAPRCFESDCFDRSSVSMLRHMQL